MSVDEKRGTATMHEKHGDLDSEKASNEVVEDVRYETGVAPGKVDYSGVAAKTDPREIKLVRKLDRYIMVSLWS